MSPAHIPLEDAPCDVITKAMRGLNMTPRDLANKAGLNKTQIRAVLDGSTDPSILKKIAPALGLSSVALTALPGYAPSVSSPAGLHHFVSPFGHAGVNSFAITHGSSATIFDTGTDASPILRFLEKNSLQPDLICITHRHRDHTACINDFQNTPVVYPDDLEHGTQLTIGNNNHLIILDVSGHANPARAYFYQGLGQPVCIVGDSIFAGSMGGTMSTSSYQTAIRTAKENILSLPPSTVLCPGHGPQTSVHLEQANNPFLNQA